MPGFDLQKLIAEARKLNAVIAFNESREDAELSNLTKIPSSVLVAERESVYVDRVSSPLAYPYALTLGKDKVVRKVVRLGL